MKSGNIILVDIIRVYKKFIHPVEKSVGLELLLYFG